MNVFQPNKRSQRGFKPTLDYLDCRIVPAALLPHMAVAADLAHANLSVHSQHNSHATASATAKMQIRQEHRLERLAEQREQVLVRRERLLERREKMLERRDLRLAQRAASRLAKSSMILAAPPLVQITPAASTVPLVSTTVQNSGTPSSTNLLPPNASQQLGMVYEEFKNGDLPTTTNQPGQPVIVGTNVEVQIHTNNPSDFNPTVAAAVSLGLQVSINDPSYDIVVGFLPIAQLLAVAQITGAPSLTAVDYPISW